MNGDKKLSSLSMEKKLQVKRGRSGGTLPLDQDSSSHLGDWLQEGERVVYK